MDYYNLNLKGLMKSYGCDVMHLSSIIIYFQLYDSFKILIL